MFKSIAEDIKQQFNFGNRITRLIIVNAAVFIGIHLINLFLTLIAGFKPSLQFSDIVYGLSLNGDLMYNLTHPWVIITHMFLHVGIWHFAFNMLFLYWFGRIVGDFLGDHRVYPLYLMAGLMGAVFYLISVPLVSPDIFDEVTGQWIKPDNYAHGASAAVMGFIVASGVIAPNYIFRLLFIGDVKLKYIVLVLLLLDLISIANMHNTGGHIAHLGGAAFGWLFVSMLQKGSDVTEPVNRLFDWIKRIVNGSPRPTRSIKRTTVFVRHVSSKKGKAASDKTPRPVGHQEQLDAILDKIKASGYESLSEEEKEFLFKASKK
jgi:membrane associated rhomboid family serine protease